MRKVVFKSIIGVFFLFWTIVLCSCGDLASKKTDNVQNQSTEKVKPSSAPIQRQIYDVKLGERYDYDALLDALRKNIEGLENEKYHDVLSHKPVLTVSKENQYYNYYVFSHRYSKGYLFGNYNWETFSCSSTLDGRIYSIEFSSTGDHSVIYEQQYNTLVNNLTKKYGEPNHPQDNGSIYKNAFWLDKNTFLDLWCSKNSLSIEYRDNAIFSEVINQQEIEGINEL